jgi:hypothetical protein
MLSIAAAFLANEATVKRVSGFELRGTRQKKTLKFGPKESEAHDEKIIIAVTI